MADNKNLVLESQLEYLSLSKPKKILYRFTHFFTNIPKKISRSVQSVPSKARKSSRGIAGIFRNIYRAAVDGDWKTRLSFAVMGFGQVTRHQMIRGVLNFLFEIVYILFMITVGGPALSQMHNLGSIAYGSYTEINDILNIIVPVFYDNSFTILLYSLFAIAMTLLLAVLWYGQIKDSKLLQDNEEIGLYESDKNTLKGVLDKDYAKTLLFIPIGTLVIFTVLPMVMMVLIAFTNYDYMHNATTAKDTLFDWVGMYNFATIFTKISSESNNIVLTVFLQVLLWTLIWAFCATFSNYFLGMIVAMIINTKGIKLKKLWRTVLITTIAVPNFISLLLISSMLADNGLVNSLLQSWGWTETTIKFLTDPVIAKITIILVNTWCGIPYSMLVCTGLLMNIPEDLYESAKIDGASPTKMYMKITLPYMLFVTGPYLISQFVGNINNFNVIYFLSGGGPSFASAFIGQQLPSLITSSGVGQTDLLITWIYKLSTNNSFDYGVASVLGLLIFALVAFFSLIFYNRSSAVQDEEAFQ